MNRSTSIQVLLPILAAISFGCASTKPDDSMTYSPASSPELEQAQIKKDAGSENYLGWGLLYSALEIGGTLFGGK